MQNLDLGASSKLMNDAPVTRVLVVEDHELMADLLGLGLGRVGLDVRIAHELTLGGVLATATEYHPHVALLDLHLGVGETCVPMIDPLARTGIRVLVLTAGTRDHDLLAECLEQGAAGLFYKAQPFGDLVDRIRDAALGRTVMEPAARDALLDALRKHRAVARANRTPFAALSTREREVLGRLMLGHAAEEIANETYVSLTTVRTHIRSILRKLGVNSQLAAVVLAQRAGWEPELGRSA